jgi:hypothetical protein
MEANGWAGKIWLLEGQSSVVLSREALQAGGRVSHAFGRLRWYRSDETEFRVSHTSHSRLKPSRSPNAASTLSLARVFRYWRSNRSQVSVYSISLMLSLRYAFSSASKVTMMLYSSARDS